MQNPHRPPHYLVDNGIYFITASTYTNLSSRRSTRLRDLGNARSCAD